MQPAPIDALLAELRARPLDPTLVLVRASQAIEHEHQCNAARALGTPARGASATLLLALEELRAHVRSMLTLGAPPALGTIQAHAGCIANGAEWLRRCDVEEMQAAKRAPRLLPSGLVEDLERKAGR